jgi:hypothetical protein
MKKTVTLIDELSDVIMNHDHHDPAVSPDSSRSGAPWCPGGSSFWSIASGLPGSDAATYRKSDQIWEEINLFRGEKPAFLVGKTDDV